MLRKLLILFCGLVLPVAASAAKLNNLHLEPKTNSKIIGAIKDTEAMVLLEQEGKWAKVVDIETGMVGWLVLNKSSNVPDNASILQ